jgi:hypothetical protein
MSLLTNEQIAELVGIASNQSTSKDLYEEFHEWNEKQPAQHVIAPNWDIAPDWANYWAVDANGIPHWFDTEPMLNIKLNEFCIQEQSHYRFLRSMSVVENWTESLQKRPKPVITPHPHAAIIAKYAEVAARSVDPWVEFEWTNEEASYVWRKHTCSPIFKDTNQYRHIGETK